jgi:hypothetical protein
MEEWMSLRAYARHRGVALSAVQKAIESRRVTAIKEDGGRICGIEKHQADAQWSANTDAAEAARSGTFQGPGKPAGAAPGDGILVLASGGGLQGDRPPAGEQPSPTGDQGNFLAARVKEAELRGELLELDKLERLGELLPRAEVRRVFSEIFAQLKIAAFRIPDRKAQALVGETDTVRIHRVLSDELRQVFDEFSRQLDVPAAGVVDDSAVVGEREAVLP